MIEVDHGEFADPWRGPRPMTKEPWIHETAVVKNSRMGLWTMVGQYSEIISSDLLDYSYAIKHVDIFNAEVGKFANIAAQVRINPVNHPMWRATLHHFTYRAVAHFMDDEDDDNGEVSNWRNSNRVIIGPDVWIGHAAIVMPGVCVGTGSIIGSGSVVTKHVPDYTIVAGNPARVIRRRVTEDVEAALTRIAWWDWDREALIKALPDFRKLSAADFAAKYDTV
jgi:phosphonate metabolism protein (transferase hexapeptide repeat family)